MSFNVVEGDYFNPEDVLDDFVRLYNDYSVPVKMIRDELGLNQRQYKECWDLALSKCLISQRISWRTHPEKEIKSEPKYYSIHRKGGVGDRFLVKKGGVTFGLVRTVFQAERMVELLKDCDWDKSKAQSIRDFVLENY